MREVIAQQYRIEGWHCRNIYKGMEQKGNAGSKLSECIVVSSVYKLSRQPDTLLLYLLE